MLTAENQIKRSSQPDIRLIAEWDSRIASDICIPSDESHEIEVIKSSIKCKNYKVFVGYIEDKAVAITYFHTSEYNCCRFDYIIVSNDYRGKGYAREILSYVTDFCRENNIKNCFLWPAHKTSERICYEAGFRHQFYSEAGRATYTEK